MISAQRAQNRTAATVLMDEQKRFYDELVENASIGIFQSSREGTYLTANPALAQIYGYHSVSDLLADLTDIGRQLYLAPGRRAEFMARLAANGRVERFESQVRRVDGTVIWISEDARAVRDLDGQFLYYEGFVREVTWRKEEETRLRHYSAKLEAAVGERTRELSAEVERRKAAEIALRLESKAKSDFLSAMSHELRTPLNAILGFAQLLEIQHPATSTATEYARDISGAGSHLLGLINDLLDLARIESGKMALALEQVCLTDLLESCRALVRPQADGRAISVTIAPMPQGLMVAADPLRLKQVLVNLMGNAVKYNHDGGTVSVQCERLDESVRIAVTDTGRGIPTERAAEVFQPFARLGLEVVTEGTGVGLAISKQFIEQMGGAIGFESEPDVGSTFWVALRRP